MTPGLEQLRDIHLPDPVSIWPLAIGWYLLIAAALLLFTLLIYKSRSSFYRNKAKKIALKQLAQLKQKPHTQNTLTQVALLLKRVAMTYHGSEQVAKLTGKSWIEFLNQSSKKTPLFSTQVAQLLTKTMYENKTKINANQLNVLMQQSEQWIKAQ